MSQNFNGLWERFCKRHPEMTLKVVVFTRAMATDKDVLNGYFDMLEDFLRCNKIFDSPFYCNETGLPLTPKSEKLWTK